MIEPATVFDLNFSMPYLCATFLLRIYDSKSLCYDLCHTLNVAYIEREGRGLQSMTSTNWFLTVLCIGINDYHLYTDDIFTIPFSQCALCCIASNLYLNVLVKNAT